VPRNCFPARIAIHQMNYVAKLCGILATLSNFSWHRITPLPTASKRRGETQNEAEIAGEFQPLHDRANWYTIPWRLNIMGTQCYVWKMKGVASPSDLLVTDVVMLLDLFQQQSRHCSPTPGQRGRLDDCRKSCMCT